MYFAGATGSIVGTCRRILRPLRSHNYNCTKDYADIDEDSDDDVDDAAAAAVDKDAGYGARTSWSP